MKKMIIAFLCLMCLAHSLSAQLTGVSTMEWQHAIGGTNDDILYSSKNTWDKGNVLFGKTNSTNGDVVGNHGGYDIWVLKLDSLGAIQWQTCLGGSGNEELYKVFPLANGNYRLLASTTSVNNGNVSGFHGGIDAWVLEIDSVGNLVWQLCLGGSATEKMEEAYMNNGVMTILGHTNSNDGDVIGNHGDFDMWAVNLDNIGTILQQKCVGGTGCEGAKWIFLDSMGQFILGDFANSSDGDFAVGNWSANTACGVGIGVFRIVCLDAVLNLQWMRMPGSDFQAFPSPCIASGGASYSPCSITFLLAQGGGFWLSCFDDGFCGGASITDMRLSATGLGLGSLYSYNGYSSSSNSTVMSSQAFQNNTGGFISYSSVSDILGAGYSDEFAYYHEMDINGNIIYNCASNYQMPGFAGLGQTGTCPSGAMGYTIPTPINPPNIIAFAGMPAALNSLKNIQQLYSQYITLTDTEDGYTYHAIQGGTTLSSTHPQNGAWTKSSLGQIASINGLHQTITSVMSLPYPTFNNLNTVVAGSHGGAEIWVVNFNNSSNILSGNVWTDLNNNNVADIGEGVDDVIIQTTLFTAGSPTSDFLVATNSNGEYTMTVGATDLTVNIPYPPLYYSYSPSLYNASFAGSNQVSNNNNFQLIPTASVADLRVDVATYFDPNPNFSNYYHISYKNVGTTIQSGYIRYYLDPLQIYQTATPLPDTINANYLSWNYNNLLPLHTENINLTLLTSITANQGDTMVVHTEIYPVIGDNVPTDNMDKDSIIVLASFDPNEILVSETGVNSTFIQNEDYLTYQVNFQNTGTDTAQNVIIKVLIDNAFNKLTLPSIDILASSYPFDLDVENDTLRFYFENIMLPDSNTSEIDSHGFVKFKVKTQNTWLMCDTLKAWADIFFDFNEAIRTNTATTTHIYPKPILNVPTDMGLCNNTNLILIGQNTQTASYLWNTNDTTQSITVTGASSTQSYWLSTYSMVGQCVSTFDTITVTFSAQPPQPTVSLLGGNAICPGDYAVLSVPNDPNYTYSWSNGNTTTNDTITQSSTYQLTITNPFGCGITFSDSVQITFFPLPDINISASGATTFCEGDSVTLTAVAGMSSYLWSNGATTQSVNVYNSGIYNVILTNNNNCTDTSLTVSVHAEAYPTIPTITQNGNTLMSSANTGNQWYMNGILIPNAIGNTYTATQNGSYAVIVTNQYGCSSISMGILLGTENIDFLQTLNISPNPTQNELLVSFEKTDNNSLQIYLYNELGQILSKEVLSDVGKMVHKIDVSHLPTGIYMLSIMQENKKISKKIAVVKP